MLDVILKGFTYFVMDLSRKNRSFLVILPCYFFIYTLPTKPALEKNNCELNNLNSFKLRQELLGHARIRTLK